MTARQHCRPAPRRSTVRALDIALATFIGAALAAVLFVGLSA